MKRFLVASVISLVAITSGVIFWAEKNFDNPTSHTQTPVGYWRVSDIKKLFDGQQKDSVSSEIKISLTAGVAAVDYTVNGVFLMFMSDLSSFSTLTKVGTDEQMYFSHQGDLFEHWDDIYVGGAKALIVATNAESGKSAVYPVALSLPDFDTGTSELVFFVRRLHDDESAEKLINLYQPKLPIGILEYGESINLISIELWVEPFSTDNDQLGS